MFIFIQLISLYSLIIAFLKMKISWRISAVVAVIFTAVVFEAYCKPTDTSNLRGKRQAVEERQFIGGLSTLGALIQPILFMIGMANFMGRIPTFFNRWGTYEFLFSVWQFCHFPITFIFCPHYHYHYFKNLKYNFYLSCMATKLLKISNSANNL